MIRRQNWKRGLVYYVTYRLLTWPMAFAAGAAYQFGWMVANHGTPVRVDGPEFQGAMPVLLILSAIATAALSYKLVNMVCNRSGWLSSAA